MPEFNERVARFVSQECFGRPDGFEKFSTMGVFDGENLIAGVVYHNWDEAAGVIELSAASISRRWLTKPVIRAMHEFPFALLGCQMVLHRVKSNNPIMLAIHRRFGSHEVVVPRGFGREIDCHVFTLTDDQWVNHPVCKRD